MYQLALCTNKVKGAVCIDPEDGMKTLSLSNMKQLRKVYTLASTMSIRLSMFLEKQCKQMHFSYYSLLKTLLDKFEFPKKEALYLSFIDSWRACFHK